MDTMTTARGAMVIMCHPLSARTTMNANDRIDCVRKILQIAKAQKSGGMFPPHPPAFGLTRKRVKAERSALAAAGRPRRSATLSRVVARGCGGAHVPPSTTLGGAWSYFAELSVHCHRIIPITLQSINEKNKALPK